jgi:uncharacterized protein (TIGR02246 family)
MRSSSSSRPVAVCLVLAASSLPASAAAQTTSGPQCAVVDVPTRAVDAGAPASGAVQDIYALLDGWREALGAGNDEAVTALVADSAEFWSQGAPPIRGRAALAEAFGPFFANYQLLQDFDCYELIIRGDLAFMRGMERNKLIPHAGGDTTTVLQRAFSVLRRSADGQWRFARGMTNEPAPQ